MKKTILVVDDSAPMRMLLAAMLGHKYKVFTATDGLTATMWLSDGNIPDMIITDIQMPHIDGLEFAKNLSDNILYSDIPVVMLTGMQLAEDLSFFPNVMQVMHKPFDPVSLMDVVDKQLSFPQTVIIAE